MALRGPTDHRLELGEVLEGALGQQLLVIPAVAVAADAVALSTVADARLVLHAAVGAALLPLAHASCVHAAALAASQVTPVCQ